jgi:hypothetical protein
MESGIGGYMDKFFKMLVEEIKIFWEELKDGCKKKIKKIVCKCRDK